MYVCIYCCCCCAAGARIKAISTTQKGKCRRRIPFDKDMQEFIDFYSLFDELSKILTDINQAINTNWLTKTAAKTL